MPPLNLPALLRQFNLHPKKSLGQNFLADETALVKVVAAAELQPTDTVLEIGPGLGSLTRHLAHAAQRVVAVELDQTLLPALQHITHPYANVEIVLGDILQLQPASLITEPYKVVANIPYYITSAVIQHLLEATHPPTSIVLTIQREVAERICAKPGDMSLLAVSVQFYSRPRLVARLSAGAFYPRPDVDSAVVHLEVVTPRALPVTHTQRFFRIVKAGFSQKRKQLRNSLAAGLQLSHAAVDEWLARAEIDVKRRAETLTMEEWERLMTEDSRQKTAGNRQ